MKALYICYISVEILNFMLKSNLAVILAKKTGLPRVAAEEGLRELIKFITQTLGTATAVEIRGFGRFSVRCHPSRRARNPKTGEKIVIEEHRVPRFKPSKFLLKRLNHE